MSHPYSFRSIAAVFGAVIVFVAVSTDAQTQLPARPGSTPHTVSLKQLSLPLEGITDPNVAKQRVTAFRDAIGSIRSCNEADALATKLGAIVTMNDHLPVSALPPQLRPTIEALPVGTATPMFGEKDKYVRTLVVCARDPS